MKSGFFVCLTLIVFSVLGGMYGPPSLPSLEPVAKAAAPQDEMSSSLHVFTKVFDLVELNFADDVSLDKSLYNGAIPGMLRTLDPHSSFLDPKTYQILQQDQHGQYYGVGMEINMDGSHVIVTQPFAGSPAAKAGIRRGDWIVSVDDRNVEKLTTPDVADLLKGPRNTKVTVGIKRQGAERKLSFLITRDEIVHSNVSTFWLKPGIAYVHVVNFSAQTTGRDMVEGLKALGEANITGLILDLRGNPGGLVSEAVTVAGHFLQKNQTVVSHRGRASAEQIFRVKTQNPNSRRYPMVVLVDKYSASAAEIVSGALQDHDRAWILGEGTFGKGLVQAQYPLSEGTALLLTIAKYHTPSGRLIQRDYEHRSFLEYYSHRDTDARNLQDVQKTDGGRTVYGGGGITPDEKYTPPAYTALQVRILRPRYTFVHFVSDYFGNRKPALPEDWKPDAEFLREFQEFLKKNNIEFTAEEFSQNRAWISDQLQIEMYTRAFNRQRADQLTSQVDPEVQKGIASLPTAQGLLDEVRRILARRR
jgi:carboxyl-terminal processing protease